MAKEPPEHDGPHNLPQSGHAGVREARHDG